MKEKIIKILKRLSHSKLEPVFYLLYKLIANAQYCYFTIKWTIKGHKKPDKEETELVCRNITFIFKSFERQKMAKRLYKNIQKYYPGVKVIIADDSKNSLKLAGSNLEIIQLPFNSGLSFGLNRALEKVTTPFVMRMDDDELLTLCTSVGEQLNFLFEHPEADLVGFGVISPPKCTPTHLNAVLYYKQTMSRAPKTLRIPHMTHIDKNHIVLGKVTNVFLARTDKVKEIGWDDNIRMIDHNEFFMRAAGNLVSVLSTDTAVFHYHNPYASHYQKYRRDIHNDYVYIMNKYRY